MTRRRRVRAAERPARRRANPSSPTKNRYTVRCDGFFEYGITINLMIYFILTRILFTMGIIAHMFDKVKKFNKILVKII